MTRAPRILLAGGGTGGHVYPAIAIAHAIRALEPEAAIAFAGTRDHLEWRAVPRAGYAIHPITVSGFHRKALLKNLSLPWKLARGLLQSWSLVGDFDADVVLGTGGYVSGPVLMAGHFRRRVVVAQEQNAYAGVTNRLVARFAAQIHIAFPEAAAWFPKEKCRLSGNPTRAELMQANRAASRAALGVPDGARVLFVFGGSLGSLAINQAMLRHLAALLRHEDLFVIWQTGRLYYKRLRPQVAPHARLHLLEYVHRMDEAYAAADLVLSRAGAVTCSELLTTRTPAILVPSPHVAEDHQTKNARSMKQLGAAILAEEKDLDHAVATLAVALLQDSARREAMEKAAAEAARPQAAQTIAENVLRLAGWKGRTNGSST